MKKIYFLLCISLLLSGCSSKENALQKSDSAAAQVGTSVVGTPVPSPIELNGSLFSLLNSGDKKCTWTMVNDGNKVDGTAYVSGMKFRAELKTKVSLLPVTAYAVGDGKNLTAWVSALPSQKFTFAYKELEQFVKEATASGSAKDPSIKEVEQFLQNNKFRCETWTVESSKFVIN